MTRWRCGDDAREHRQHRQTESDGSGVVILILRVCEPTILNVLGAEGHNIGATAAAIQQERKC